MQDRTVETAFTRALGLRLPIAVAPMGSVAGPRLVAAATEAGALGILPIWTQPLERAAAMIEATRALTSGRFAVNVRADLSQLDLIAAATDRGVDMVHLFWGDPSSSAATVRRGGARMIVTVSDADTTKAALDAGADALIAQGVEAGGHVYGTTPFAELLPTVVELAGNTPVAAAGGLADAEDVVRAVRLGAAAVLLGTRFAASEESDAHSAYKHALIVADGADTVLTSCFDIGWPDAPHRVLRNSTFQVWDAAGRLSPGARPGEGDVVMRSAGGTAIPRYHAALPLVGMTGELEAAALYAGTGVGKVRSIRPARALIEELAEAIAAA